ncbi:MAG TPA: SUF system NifU family Fe-S cluster assembly protein [Trueperaceae bacterium]|nr:SUF system NifU family Fe-S cluster assembly protein [Trueperaceae bacterium]
MNTFLETLYKDVILEHYRRPHHRGRLEDASHTQEGVNPSCGDELTLYLRVEDGVIRDVAFEGEGCAISQASASLMTDALEGVSVERARTLSGAFKAMIQGEPPTEDLGDLALLQGISKLHARVKCASLAWNTLDTALGDHAPDGSVPDEPAD